MSGVKIMFRLIALLDSLAYVMLLAVLNGTLGFICAMGVTLFGALGIAKFAGEPIGMSYTLIGALAIACGMLRGVLRYFEQYSNHYIAFRLLAVIRSKVFGALRQLCPAKLECKQKGSIIAMITSDIETLEVFYAHTVSPICIAVLVMTVVIIFVGFVSSWILAAIAVIGYIMIGFFVPMVSSRVLKEPGKRYRNELASFNSYFLDSIKGIREILLHNAGLMRKEEVNSRSDFMLQETRKMKRLTSASGAFTDLLVAAIILLTAFVGIVLVENSQISLGSMIIGLVAIFSSFGPVIAVSALPGNLTQTFASGERILNLIDETPAVSEVTNGRDFDFESLEIDNLTFGYDTSAPVLKKICLQAKKGEIIGIVGESGCGKSTLLKLLMRFWKKTEGAIRYNEDDIEDINSESLLSNVTLVSQSTYLFDDTIEGNLRIAKPEASRDEIESACRMASIHDFIMTLPQGYATEVGNLGSNLSAGEKQRIGLARAFLSGAELILMDEPTSNVDCINEGVILRSIKEQKRKKSIILVSHRESTMAIADRVYQINNGRICEKI